MLSAVMKKRRIKRAKPFRVRQFWRGRLKLAFFAHRPARSRTVRFLVGFI